MTDPSEKMVLAAVGVFILAAITDYFDGFIARKYDLVSDFGKLLDPLADKILVMTALVMLVAQRSDVFGDPWVPGWMVVLILAREIWVTGLRGVAASRGIVVAAGSGGKVKSALQMVAIVFLLLHNNEIPVGQVTSLVGIGRPDLVITCQLIGMNLLVFSLVFAYWSACDYTAEILGGGE